MSAPRGPGRIRSLLDRIRRRRRRREPELPPDAPPDIGVREPRRPRPSAGSGTSVVEPPPTDEREA